MNACTIDTPLGEMLAVGNSAHLKVLRFTDNVPVREILTALEASLPQTISLDTNMSLDSIQQELRLYFSGKLKVFKTPIAPRGTPFQRQVWEALTKIPYGKTWAYSEQAASILKPSAARAVANANGKNPLAIVIPCHRVIQRNGTLGGYHWGLSRKEFLLSLEA